MDALMGLIFLIIFLGFFIFLCAKGKMKWASFSLLLLTSLYPIILGLIFIYALPASPETKIEGPVLPIIPFITGCIILLLSFLTLKLSNKDTQIHGKASSLLGWILIFVGVISQIIGLTLVLISLYSPSVIGLSVPSPNIGIIAFIVATSVSAIALKMASSRNTKKYVNLFRWVAFWIVFVTRDQPVVISLILLYAFPSRTPVIFPFWAGINMIALLPYSILLLFLARGYVPAKI